MTKTELRIERPDGAIDMVDISDKFSAGITAVYVDKYRKATAAAGRGNVIEAVMTYTASNYSEISKALRAVYNEGADGYEIPEEQIKNHATYREWTETEIVK